MTFWNIMSWVFVALLTGINIFVFLKLKSASEQMLKMAFPGAKNMTEALSQMQKMMGGFAAFQGKGGKGSPAGGAEAQLKTAMDLLQQMKKNSR